MTVGFSIRSTRDRFQSLSNTWLNLTAVHMAIGGHVNTILKPQTDPWHAGLKKYRTARPRAWHSIWQLVRTKSIDNNLLQIVYILLSFQNTSIEKSELFAILDYWGHACYVKRGVTLIFYRESKRSIWVQNFVSAVWNLEMIKNTSNNFGLLLGHFRVVLYG